MKSYPFSIKITVYLLFVILAIFALIQARNFLYPIFIAILVAYLLFPIAKRLERLKIPRILANFISIILAFGVIFAGFYLLYQQLIVFAEDIPTFREQAINNINRIEETAIELLNMEHRPEEGLLKKHLLGFLEASGYFLETALTATAGTIAKLALVPVYVFFMLYYRNKFHDFILLVTPSEKHVRMQTVIREISNVTKRYMGGIVIVVLLLCILNSIGLMIVGIQYPILFGILSALMNFIPYFGTLIGGAIPFLFALLTEESPGYALGVVILFLIIQFTENNILTPNIVGGKLNINPLFIILTIVIGGVIWGLPGMIVSVPFVGMFKIFCDNMESLKPYSFLLSSQGTEKHAITIKKLKQVFKSKKQKDSSSK
ncbi:AI-2E family transporter [Cytophagaceae bacterium ABcell3]|nr:AI-2E family transporter [Cytophagaceae bacterium ABcell3]